MEPVTAPETAVLRCTTPSPANSERNERGMNDMALRGVCDRCKDRKNLVTVENGVEFFKTIWGLREWVADVHRNCKNEWLKEHNGTTDLQALPKKR
jgi:hypothetical protein